MDRARELAAILLDKARGDAWIFRQVAPSPDAPSWGLGFHAQQVVEKSLKAVLAAHEIEFPRTHNLALLLDLLSDAELPLPPDRGQLPLLTPFGTLLRYDIEPADIEGEDLPAAEDMTRWVEATLRWAEDQLADR